MLIKTRIESQDVPDLVTFHYGDVQGIARRQVLFCTKQNQLCRLHIIKVYREYFVDDA